MLLTLFQREDTIHTETRLRQKDASLLTCWEMGRKKRFWGRHNEYWARVGGGYIEDVGLSWSFQE